MTVVVGVDGSETAKAALRLAAQEARWRQVSLVAVTAYEPPIPTPAGGFPAASKHTSEEERVTAESALRDTVTSELGDQAGETDLRVAAGLAGRVIVETARQVRAELIVLAASPGKSMLPGTVSHYVLSHAECPVLIVPSDDKHGDEHEKNTGQAAGTAAQPH
jgi:nucleotide-binding universal stress UspA family protein